MKATTLVVRSSFLTSGNLLFINCWYTKCPQHSIDAGAVTHCPEGLLANNTHGAARETLQNEVNHSYGYNIVE